jgi:predicted dehydrogenase
VTTPLRFGVIGLGSMGRHHARIAGSLEGIELVGGVDPQGDVYQTMRGLPVYGSVGELLGAGIDAAVVAVPSEDHLKVATQLADAGVHALIEKPLAPETAAAEQILNAFRDAGLVAGVGHVERYNPALRELKQRLLGNALGRIFAITTRRVGPFPLRVRDVGVVKDLATHDLDLILWLGGRVESITSQLAHRMGRPHEDLVEAIGRLDNGAVLSISVNWLTPTKERSVTVLGEGGALVADMLSADLTYYANADVPMEWDYMARLKGVSEGDMVRYAIRKREPLVVELENFRDAIVGDPGADVVSLDDGLEVVRLAERLLKSSDGLD